MSDMKCPFCRQEVEKVEWQDGDIEIGCSNCDIAGSAKLWQELIRTRKALEVAKEGLKRIDWCATDYGIAQDTLDEITKLEQKDVK